jgi:hypothetical protein
VGDGSLAVAAEVACAAGFELRFLEPGGGERRGQLSACWDVRFEEAPPVREFPAYRGQRHFSGLWWAATTGGHVGFESWLERDQVMMLDFRPEVVAFSSQPFWLVWPEAERVRRHAPDYFARLRDGTGVVIDVRADDQIPAEDAEAFAAAGSACSAVGWDYQRVGVVDAVLAANVRWLSGYRHSRCFERERAALLEEAFTGPCPLWEGARAVGDPIAVLPVLFHLLWTGVLVADLGSAPLSDASMVWAAAGGRR